MSEFVSLLWILDPHYEAMRKRGCGSFHNMVVSKLFGYNDPKKHGHKVNPIYTSHVQQMLLSMEMKLDRKYMESSHMNLLRVILRSVYENTSKYLDHTHSQRDRVQASHQTDTVENSVKYFAITKLRQTIMPNSYFARLKELKDHLHSCDLYSSVEIRKLISCSKRQKFYNLIVDNCDIFHFKLPSQGPNPAAVHFLWKEPKDATSEEQRTMLVNNLRSNAQTFYDRAGRREVKQCLHRLRMVKPHAAEYLIRTISNDSSQANDKSQKGILERLDRVVSLGEDVVVDLRKNNGSIPKFDEF